MEAEGRFSVDVLSTPLHQALLGTSPVMREVNDLIRRMADTKLTVLITGESGTGKDIAARLLHRFSSRAEKPFIKVNCPAIPESILESELFGYERGAFTGAYSSKPGHLELAHTGTLFLDEIAETSHAVQGKLLQMLDGEPIMRVGGVKPIACDVRLLAATNIEFEEAVQTGRIREDVYFRLTEAHVHLPPLREHAADIPLLAEHFNYNFRRKFDRSYEPLPSDYLERMMVLPWPGNVRELASCVRKYVTTGLPEALLGEPPGDTVLRGDPRAPTGILPARPPIEPVNRPDSTATQPVVPGPRRVPSFVPLKEATRRAVEATERALIEEALRYTLWNRRKAAKLLGISYSSLLRRIDAYTIGEHVRERKPDG